MAHSEGSTVKSPQDIMQEAMSLQHQQNREDQQWLKELGISQGVQNEILVRMIRRGGDWLDFTEKIVGYKGDFKVLTQQVS